MISPSPSLWDSLREPIRPFILRVRLFFFGRSMFRKGEREAGSGPAYRSQVIDRIGDIVLTYYT